MDSSDNNMGEGDEGVEVIKLSVAEVDMKSAAFHTLGNMADACPALFAPYMPRAAAIIELSSFYIDNIREQAVECKRKVVLGVVKLCSGGKLPPYKQGLPCYERFPSSVE